MSKPNSGLKERLLEKLHRKKQLKKNLKDSDSIPYLEMQTSNSPLSAERTGRLPQSADNNYSGQQVGPEPKKRKFVETGVSTEISESRKGQKAEDRLHVPKARKLGIDNCKAACIENKTNDTISYPTSHQKEKGLPVQAPKSPGTLESSALPRNAESTKRASEHKKHKHHQNTVPGLQKVSPVQDHAQKPPTAHGQRQKGEATQHEKQAAGDGGASPESPFPYPTDDADHAETPAEAYRVRPRPDAEGDVMRV